MNVNMVEHQRSILSTLGIDLWMPKVGAQTHTFTSSLYRDQAAPEVNDQSFNLDQNIQIGMIRSDEVLDVQRLDTELRLKNTTNDSSRANLATQVEVVATEHLTQPVEAREAIFIEPFELQLCVMDSCIIVVDTTTMSAEQAGLWLNIQAAKQSQFSALKWPFPLAPLQDGRGVNAYIQGFIDAFSAEKKVLSLGKIKHIISTTVIELSTLQEMLDQPQLKRVLWKQMQ